MRSLQEVPVPRAPSTLALRPRVIDGAGPGLDVDGLMTVMEAFAGYDSCLLAIDDPSPTHSIWDDALDVRVACL
jgi:hypothetical protein